MNWDAEHPLLLDSPRVWRTYLGGALLDEMHGAALPLRAPQQVFVPAACGDITLRARAPMHLLQCFGPGQDV